VYPVQSISLRTQLNTTIAIGTTWCQFYKTFFSSLVPQAYYHKVSSFFGLVLYFRVRWEPIQVEHLKFERVVLAMDKLWVTWQKTLQEFSTLEDAACMTCAYHAMSINTAYLRVENSALTTFKPCLHYDENRATLEYFNNAK